VETSKNIVLITGGSSGIGLELAKKFLKEGNEVIIIGRSKEKLLSVKTQYPDIQIEDADITDEEDRKMLAGKYGNVNILVNNAGIHYDYDLKDKVIDSELIKSEIDTNLIGPILLTKYFLPNLLAKESAAIINVSSYLGIASMPSAPGYSASKAGIHSFTKALRGQLYKTNIKVFDLVPPITDTAMTKDIQKKGINKLSTEELVGVFWKGFKNDQYEIYHGLAKVVFFLNRLCPKYLENKMRKIADI
jgi:short-subunit dehydrogenase involved in D-alanine esterification of teichoic acids